MIKAIIFDCFGVLTTDGWLAYRGSHFANDPAKLQQANELIKKVDRGELSYDIFTQMIASMANDTATHVHAVISSHVRNEQLLEQIKATFYGHYKLGILSNAPANVLNKLFTEAQIAWFDAVVLSYEIGAIKPDPRAYQAILQKLDVLAEEAIFIDDRQEYVDGATAIGIHALQYKSVDQTRKDIEEILDGSEN